ncbi:MAG: histidine phosphatase family protein [Chitinophagaceae bacterium]|nr:histidine phosphatase family protein [Chitinophagaceae bacterium]
MKYLFIIRHAKSDWNNPILSDFERPLNNRGNKDAPDMAIRLKDKNFVIDQFVTSTANRALSTAKYFAHVYGKSENDILKIDELYHASPKIFFRTIEKLNNQYHSVAIFSHNPGITDFVNMLTKTQIDNMPTCSIFAISIQTESWKLFSTAKKEFLFFDYPKSIL